jgi:hypothetical protein
MTLILGVFVVASAAAQDAVFLIESTHKATFALHTGNTCEWNVYKVNEFSDTKDANLADNDGVGDNDDFLFVGDVNITASIDITWKNPGKYYLIVEEFNGGLGGCSTRRAFAIEVIESSTIEFKEYVSNDCSNVGNKFETELVIATSGIVDSKFYPIQVYYSIDDTPVVKPISVIDSKLLKFDNFNIIPEYTDKYQKITILFAKDKYGGDIKVTLTGGVNVHTRTLYGLPPVSTINHN